ncbi:glycosyltransferase family 2 protein [Hymenobacter nivis]|uniref:Glycosyltransferase 2-like domain-containing protein n=1 Tax=Hymenobacter nivis TaxID=1850093 RepID=A0A2Z3GL19_9BACT|nr:glycosyltransferase family 2 protein [Hymenobacter nivis]AWM34909.1 hypothetical protein DDQ68_20300 [Hymenobacter nivis]
MIVSIVIPSFRQPTELDGALLSIAQQSRKDYEIIIVDGGSQDETEAVVKKYSHLPITFKSEPDKGIYDAMNKGIILSKGSYVYFMGCDDRLAAPDVLEKVFDCIDITNNHVIYGDALFSDTGMRYDGEFTHFKLLEKNICHQAIFTRKDVFARLGNFDTRYVIYADWEFNMRWFNTSWLKRRYVGIIVSHFNATGFSSSHDDKVFFAEQQSLIKKYFPKIVQYLIKNRSKRLHQRTINFLTFNRIEIIKKLMKI